VWPRRTGSPPANGRLYREWHRRPGDLEAFRELRDAISEHLVEVLAPDCWSSGLSRPGVYLNGLT